MRRVPPSRTVRRVKGRAALARLRGLPPERVDLLVGLLLVAAGFLTAEVPDVPAAGLVVLSTLPYVVRRRYPLPVLIVSSTGVVALLLRELDPGGLSTVIAFGAYTVAAHRPSREVTLAAAYLAGCLVVLLLSDNPDLRAGELAAVGAVFGAALALGVAMRSRGREQALAAQQAAADERLRIAQEVHDVVAHSLGVIAVQAGVGMHVLDQDPEEARRALTHISETSRSSLSEIRRLLGVIRSGDASYAPAPGPGDLPALADQVAAAGLAVELRVDDAVGEVPPGVGLAAYRIVQEALTNALRHARADAATVSLAATDGCLRITVVDDGRGPAAGGRPGGHGLVGMRERAAVYGGTVDAGPGPGGGFVVTATLPYGGAAAS